ncbi:hypothetical protein ANN_12567 [Periplaneta americana]|uniref:Uncharacterized protein n=1 Tax=Periplaneta americana TaxID=6978 RepID=A0ABQ8TIV0_PERAM|nr:hypothetical protein ANN_12567 [Periplaneta americana]
MAGLCEGGNEPTGSLKAIFNCPKTSLNLKSDTKKAPLMWQLGQEIMGYGGQFFSPPLHTSPTSYIFRCTQTIIVLPLTHIVKIGKTELQDRCLTTNWEERCGATATEMEEHNPDKVKFDGERNGPKASSRQVYDDDDDDDDDDESTKLSVHNQHYTFCQHGTRSPLKMTRQDKTRQDKRDISIPKA